VSVRSATCPACGRELEGAAVREDVPKVPWHFTLLLVALGLYLSWRFVQLALWLAHRL
jgi:hypothetical protein